MQGKIIISTGRSRKDLNWKPIEMQWEDLCKKLSEPVRTRETQNEYNTMKKQQKDVVKDVGGFVGGIIQGGRRTKENIVSRSLITLDADYAKPDTWDIITMLYDYQMCCYSTHSHTQRQPRLRLIIPLDREVTPDEYEPIARLIAKDFNIELFDTTTFEASRLMYWPSTSQDGEFLFERQDGEPLSADETLARYKDWTNALEWPRADREQAVHQKVAIEQSDPETKPGIVGLFCRTYDVESAIDTFLSDVYIRCDEPNRYTYTPGSTSAGVVIYEKGKFAFSHHATDPAGGKLCNAFDLVRLHKFGNLDWETDPDTPITKRPSYKAMQEFASEIKDIKRTLVEEKMHDAREDFKSEEWKELPSTGKNADIIMNQTNVEIILRNDPNLKHKMKINEFTQRLVIVDDLPWRICDDHINGTPWSDMDDSGLRGYLQRVYDIRNPQITDDALKVVSSEESFHPVRNYLWSLEWDGIPRVDTLFIDYMGAEDDEYTRTVTKKWLVAAVARVMNPGCKFDNLIVLIGNQGIGKSFLAMKLGRHWFSDTFLTVQGKDGMDQLRGCWIIEIAELSALKKAEADNIKYFLSKQEDHYRQAYCKHPQNFPRQCVFYGSTNEMDFLKDRTGNRRYWPIQVDTETVGANKVFNITEEEVDQIWAEALHLYKAGETLYLTREVEKMAREIQEAYVEDNPKLGMIEEYLDKPLPEDWESLDEFARKDFIQGYRSTAAPLTLQRNQVSAKEILVELFEMKDCSPSQAKEIHSLMSNVKNWRRLKARKSAGPYGLQTCYERVS